MGVPAFVNVGTLSGSTSVTSRTSTLPASLVTGNLLIALIQVAATGKTIAISGAGWSTMNIVNSGSISVGFATRYVDGTETAPSFSWTGAANVGVQLSQWSGVQAVTPVGFKKTGTGSSSTVSCAAAGAVTTQANSRIVALTGLTQSDSGDTSNFTRDNNSFATPGGNLSIHSMGAPTSGAAVDDFTYSLLNSRTWGVHLIELLGTGATVGAYERASQSYAQALVGPDASLGARVSQAYAQALVSLDTSLGARASQSYIQVLRSVADAPASVPTSQAYVH